MDRITDSGNSKLLQPQADSNGFVNRRSPVQSGPPAPSSANSVKVAKTGDISAEPVGASGSDRPFLLAVVSAGLRRHVSDNGKADHAADRFLFQVDRTGGPSACWPWTGRVGTDGYGMFSFCGRTIGAHRIACMLAHGAPPAADSQACHDPNVCASRLCCNPAHLRWDSPAGNQHDVRITLTRRGERNPKAKLTEAQAREIWRRRSECGYVLLARKMGLPEKAVRHVLDGTNWAWLTGANPRPVDPRALAAAILDRAEATS